MKTGKLALIASMFLILLGGCGGKYETPFETYREYRSGSYKYSKGYRGFESATSASMTGGRMYVVFYDTLSQTGEVLAYSGQMELLSDIEFRGLNQPIVVGTGPTRVAVADTFGGASVKVYGVSGGDPLASFTDQDWHEISALALDREANVYVADVAMNFVRSYDSEGNPRFETDLADSGFGIGHVVSPAGLRFDGEYLIIAEADSNKAQVQRIRTDTPQQGVPFSSRVPFISRFLNDQGDLVALEKPVAVSVDIDGSLYVVDQSLGQVFRFNARGDSVSIDSVIVINEQDPIGPERFSAALSVDTFFKDKARVYVLDTGPGIVHRWNYE